MAEQEMSVHDKQHPALGPTEQEQDVDSLARNIVPPGAYVDPSNINALNNSVNVSVNEHPNPLAADYGESASDTGVDNVQGTLSVNGHGNSSGDKPEDRGEWKKADWVDQAKEYDIPHSGNTDEVKGRVEQYEAFKAELAESSREDLEVSASEYDIDADTYSSDELLAAAILASEYGHEVHPGDKSEQ